MYQIKEQEKIFVYTGPDGSGRKTVAKMVATAFDMETVLSYTTRSPRHYEINGEDYHFVNEETFSRSFLKVSKSMDFIMEFVNKISLKHFKTTPSSI